MFKIQEPELSVLLSTLTFQKCRVPLKSIGAVGHSALVKIKMLIQYLSLRSHFLCWTVGGELD